MTAADEGLNDFSPEPWASPPHRKDLEYLGVIHVGRSIVWAAHHKRLDRRVAVKLLDPTITPTLPNGKSTIPAEVSALKLLNGEGAAELLGGGIHPDHGAFVIVEYMEHGTLRDYIQNGNSSKQAQRNVFQLLKLGQQTTVSLQRVHQRGVLHLDLKPSNIGLTSHYPSRNRVVKLLDFGSSLRAHDSHNAFILATPGYCAPERFRGAPPTRKSDIYSLGCVLYELFEGRPAFMGESPDEYIDAHLHGTPAEPVFPGLDNPLYADLLRQLIGSMLLKDPMDRPALSKVRSLLKRFGRAVPLDWQPLFPVSPLTVWNTQNATIRHQTPFDELLRRWKV